MSPLFRQTALQSLSSPEQLDQLMRVTRPRAWIGLTAIAVILAAALAWSVFGSLPVTVTGQGVVLREGGVFNFVAHGGGAITQLADLHVGDRVRQGELIATLSQPVLELQVGAAKAELERQQADEQLVLNQIASEEPEQRTARTLQRGIQASIIAAAQERLRSLRTLEQQQAGLLRDGLITHQRYEDTRQAIFTAQTDIDNARNTLQRLALEALTERASREERRRAADARVEQARLRLRELEKQLELASRVRATMGGTVVEVMAMRGDTVAAGRPIISVEAELPKLSAMVFVPPLDNAQLVRAGMRARISPVTAKKEHFGYMIGKVVAVAKYPATYEGMMAVLNHDALVRELMKSGPPVSVEVELVPDPSTKSGYEWSSRAGASVELNSGTLCSGSFVVERKRPISLLIPLLRETLGL